VTSNSITAVKKKLKGKMYVVKMSHTVKKN